MTFRFFMLYWLCTCLAGVAQVLPPGGPYAEPMTQLSIQGIPFRVRSPISAPPDKRKDFTRELVRLQWRSGDPVDVFIIKPITAKPPAVTLFLYSWPSDDDRFFNDAWCRGVTQRGVAAVGFVSALTGPRYHDRPWKEWFVSELAESVGQSVHDVQLIVNYLQTRPDLDVTRIGMFGQGSGGTVALLAAFVEPRISAVDVIDPWGDWPDWFAHSPIVPEFQRAELNTPEFLGSLTELEPLRVLPLLASGRVRYQATPNLSNPDLVRAKLLAAARHLTTVQYDTERDYRERAMNDAAILDWLTGKLERPIPVQEPR